MNKKIVTICIIVIFMLAGITYSTAYSINKTKNGLSKKWLNQCSIHDNLTFEVKTDKQEYKLGEPVKISLQLTNTGNEQITLTAPSMFTHDFIVLNQYWFKRFQWSEGLSFATVVTAVFIPAGETLYWNETWNQKGTIFSFMPLIFRHQLRPGKYYIIGTLPEIIEYENFISYTSIQLKH
jgi:hypothetical protein